MSSLIKLVRNRTLAKELAAGINSRFAARANTQTATVAGPGLVVIDGRTVPAAGIDAPRGSRIAVANAGSPGIAVYVAAGAALATKRRGGA